MEPVRDPAAPPGSAASPRPRSPRWRYWVGEQPTDSVNRRVKLPVLL